MVLFLKQLTTEQLHTIQTENVVVLQQQGTKPLIITNTRFMWLYWFSQKMIARSKRDYGVQYATDRLLFNSKTVTVTSNAARTND
jgi:hypothetical protein